LQSTLKNHALIDGNKRLGWVATAVFLELIGETPSKLTNDAVDDLVYGVAAGEPSVDEIAALRRVHSKASDCKSASHPCSLGLIWKVTRSPTTVDTMSQEKFTDEYGFAGPLPLTSTQRMIPTGDFQPGLAIGQAAPDFELPNHLGETISFHADRDGSRAALLFYRSAVW